MTNTWLRVVRQKDPDPGQTKIGRNSIRRVEVVVGGDVCATLLVQDCRIDFPVGNIVRLQLSTPFFEEVFE